VIDIAELSKYASTNAEVDAISKRSDPVFWAQNSGIKLLGNTSFSLDGCEYMGDVMRDRARHIGVIKGAQARITTAFMLREIHALIYGKYTQGSIYYFPSETAVTDFSKSRFGPLIDDNASIRKHLRSTNSASLKRVGDAFLALKGCRSNSPIKDNKDSDAVRTFPADSVIRDERDRFDDIMADMTNDRLLNSKIKREVDLGTPTIPDVGMDKIFGESDQKHRQIKCHACGGYTCIAREFPNSVRYRKSDSHARHLPYFGCIKCGKEIFPLEDGEFVADFPSKYSKDYPDEGISAYHISHFITPNCNLSIVMADYEKALQDSSLMGKFYNKYLGFAYIDIEDRLLEQDVLNCCGESVMKSSSVEPTCMAADIMKTNRVVIAEKHGKEKAKIIKMARVSGFDALFDLLIAYNVRSAVICLRPYEESFRKFQQRVYNYDSGIKVFGSEYDTGKQRILKKEDEKAGVYVIARTEMMDKSQRWIRSGNLEIPRNCDEVKIFAKECCNTAKVLEVNDDTGDRVYRYRPVGDKQEHYRHCVNYLMLALDNLHVIKKPFPFKGGQSDYDPLTWGL